MTKTTKKLILAVLAVVVLAVSLVGCTNYAKLEGGNAEAISYNNNSLVVSQGEYIYFVNGRITVNDIAEKKDNKYGNVVKSAIYRAKKDGSEAKVVVPQVAMDSNNSNGISVLGEYIYYTSPSTAVDKTGAILKNNTDFFRVNINGGKPQKIATVASNTMQYKFTDKGLIYFNENKIHFVKYDAKKVYSDKVVAEDISSTYFPVTSTYDPSKENDATMNVFFIANPDKDYKGDAYNDIKYVNSNGEIKEFVSGKETKTSYTLKSVEKDGDSVAVYFEKSIFNNGNSEQKGLFGILMNSDMTAGTEKQFTNRTGLTVRYNSYAKGVYIFENKKMYIPNISNGEVDDQNPLESYSLATESGSISATDIFAIRTEADEKTYMYYITSNSLYKVEMGNNKLGTAVQLIEKNIVTDYVKPVLNGDTFYYINSGYYNYMYKVTLSNDGNSKHSILGVRTKDDATAYVEYVKGLKTEDRAAHDKLIEEDLEIK